MKFIALLGRILFSLIFTINGTNHFKEQTIQYAASHGVMMPNIIVPIAGVMAIAGGISILLGWKAKFGGWLIVAFLIPVTFIMHNFWTLEGHERQMQMSMFMKNISMLGGAFLITYFGAGPLSVDNKTKNAPAK